MAKRKPGDDQAAESGAGGPVDKADEVAITLQNTPKAQEVASKARPIGPEPASERARAQFNAKLKRLRAQAYKPPPPDREARIEEHEQTVARVAKKVEASDDAGTKPKRERKRRETKPVAATAPDLERAELVTALQNVTEEVSIMSAVARWCWWEARNHECPADRVPTLYDMAAVLVRVPDYVWQAANARLAQVYRRLAGWTHDPRHPERPTLVARVWQPVTIAIRGSGSMEHPTVLYSVAQVHARWCAMPEDQRPPHPLAPLVLAWQQERQQESPEAALITDKDMQIMPRNVAMVEHDAPGYYLSRFGVASHQAPDGQLLMDFAREDERGPTLPAEVWTIGLPEAEKRGAVIPLPFRIWIGGVLHVPLHARHGNQPIKLEGPRGDPLTLRRFLSWAYNLRRHPRTGRIEVPGPAAYWQQLKDAIDLVNEHETPYVRNGHLWLRRVVTVDKPGEYDRDMLDDPWGVTVWLPPGDGRGPRISLDRLQRWWGRGGDAAAVRALINLRFRWYIEGRRVVPAKGKGKKHWLQSRDPNVYDKLIDADKDAICFPAGTGKTRRDMRLIDANAVLEKLVREGDAIWHDGRLMPPETNMANLSHWPRTQP